MGTWHPIGDGEWVGTDPSADFPIYTRGNIGEVYPEVYRPLSFSLGAEMGERAMRSAILGSGLVRPSEFDKIPITTAAGTGVFGGYGYLNLSIQRHAATRVPGGRASDADTAYLGGGDTDPPPHRPRANERNRRATLGMLRHFIGLLRTTDAPPELAADQRRVDEYLAALPDPATATDDQLRVVATDQMAELFAELFENHLHVSAAAGGTMTILTRLCEQRLGDPNVAVTLVAGLGDVDSAAPSMALWSLGRTVAESPELSAHFDAGVAGLLARLTADPTAADFIADFESFVAEFGSRGPNEWDTAFDTWETAPELALTLIDRMRGADPDRDPIARQKTLAARRAVLERDVATRLRWPVRPLFARVLRVARLFARSRERSKTTAVRAIHGVRLRAQELDRRLVERSGGERGDLWFLVSDELDAYLAAPGSFAATIAERRRMLAELERRIPPFYFEGHLPPLDEWPLRDAKLAQVTAGEVIEGLAGCPGVARGRARIVTDPADPRGLEPGDVLVAPLTDPSWTPLFVPAEAVVVDVGAVMSHAVIVSRELGIPCAVSVRDATRRIPDGAIVEVDGGTGRVTVLELPLVTGFTRAELESYAGATVPDLVGDALRLLFVGINPGLWTAATRTHFAHPGNRFYPALYTAGIIERQIQRGTVMSADDRHHLLARGIGLTNVVHRATAKAAELSPTELRAGGERLRAFVEHHRPAVVAIAGITAYRTAFGEPRALTGEQAGGFAGARLWVVPNPSGLNAHETVETLAAAYRAPAVAAGIVD